MARPRPEGKRVAFFNLRHGEPVVSPLNVRLAAEITLEVVAQERG